MSSSFKIEIETEMMASFVSLVSRAAAVWQDGNGVLIRIGDLSRQDSKPQDESRWIAMSLVRQADLVEGKGPR